MDFIEFLVSVILAVLCAAVTSFYLKSQYQQQQIERLQKQTSSNGPANYETKSPSVSEDEVAHLQMKITNLSSQIEHLTNANLQINVKLQSLELKLDSLTTPISQAPILVEPQSNADNVEPQSNVDSLIPSDSSDTHSLLPTPCDPLQLELGSASAIFETHPNIDDTNQELYKKQFVGKEHIVMTGNDPTVGPVILCMLPMSGTLENTPTDWKILLKTKKKDELFKILDKSPKEVLIYVQLEKPEIAKIKFENKGNLTVKLQQLEEKFKVMKYKFGVLYCKKGQKSENEIYANVEMSREMEEFVEFLGTKIRLLNWSGYTGGLNTKYDSTGTHSIFTKFSEIDIMFHVCTLLPYSEKDLQQVERKRHIGNDAVVIIFLDSDAQNFDPRILVSEFNHIYVLVSPIIKNNETYYRVEIAFKSGVKPWNPPLIIPSIYKKTDEFRNFFLTKLINGERSAMESPAFATKLARTKAQMLEEFMQ